jgi:peptidoglycan/xylan/chitin deacetylase (PgdA/CDA1 family)
MYHYVRPIKDSVYARIKGLEVSNFEKQLDYLTSRYQIVNPYDVLGYIGGKNELPENACLLTFDDGYKDHYQYVLPSLLNRGLFGAFFPSAKSVLERDLLDVNAIHFILACCETTEMLLHDLRSEMYFYGITDITLNACWEKYAVATRYDNKEIAFFKKMLQFVIESETRKAIIKKLFQKYVGRENITFADELYMSFSEVSNLLSHGMLVGGHGYNHLPLNNLGFQDQEFEIDQSVNFLRKIGSDLDGWAMCYPYGAYSQVTIDLLRAKKCALAFTTKPEITLLKNLRYYEVERLNTNDFPS